MPKVSTMDFSSDVSQMNQQCMHIKMPLGPNCRAEKLVDPYPRETRGAQWNSNLDWGEGYEDMTWDEDIWPQIEDQTNIAIISALPMCKELEQEVFTSDEKKYRYKRFVFLSPDFGTGERARASKNQLFGNREK